MVLESFVPRFESSAKPQFVAFLIANCRTSFKDGPLGIGIGSQRHVDGTQQKDQRVPSMVSRGFESGLTASQYAK
jgi:hypothetical protein